MKNLVIYRITNTKTGKSYIGQTRQGFARRKGEHVARLKLGERDHKLYQSMRKHGLDAFEFTLLCHALQPEHLDGLERHFIAAFDSFAHGYNMTAGGDGISDETRAKLSVALTGRKLTWVDKIVATRRANGFSTKGLIPTGEANPNAKSFLVQTPTGRLLAITGLKAFCREAGLTFKGMYDTLNGVQTHHKGYVLLSQLGASLNRTFDRSNVIPIRS